MNFKNLYILLAVVILLNGCGLYSKYKQPTDLVVDNVYGEIDSSDSTNIGQLPWQEFFKDEQLQKLIEAGIKNNTNLQIAYLNITQAEASLKAAKLAFVPSFGFSPQGAISSSSQSTTYSYSLPITASWQLDVFGALRNAKMSAKESLESSKSYRQAVQTSLVASIATQYYSIVMLREQEQLLQESSKLWVETIRAMKLLMSVGQFNDAAVSQAEANYTMITLALLEIQQSIREVENSLSVTLAMPIQKIESGSMSSWGNPKVLKSGIPLSLLSQRPDVMQSEHNLAMAFYGTNQARSAFYPAITLGGSAGWTNILGVIVNPGQLLLEAFASLTQPIFQNGRLTANLKIAKAQQESAKLTFQQTLLNAGMEVNNALTQMQTYSQTTELYKFKISALERTVNATTLLMEGGSSSYLEVLTAQSDLLTAQQSLVENRFKEISSAISLYQALGGGRD